MRPAEVSGAMSVASVAPPTTGRVQDWTSPLPAEGDDGDGVSTLVPVPAPEGTHIRRGGEVVSKRLLQRACPMTMEDEALRLPVRIPSIEETLHLAQQLLDPQPADVEPRLRAARRVRPSVGRGGELLGAALPEPDVLRLPAEWEEIRDRAADLERARAHERAVAGDLHDLALLPERDDPDARARLHLGRGLRLGRGLGPRLRGARRAGHGRAPGLELSLRLGRRLHRRLRLQPGEQLRDLRARRVEVVRERRAHPRRGLALRPARPLVRGLGRTALGGKPRALLVERAERLAERAALPTERRARPLDDGGWQPHARGDLDRRRAPRRPEVELVRRLEPLRVEADAG